jgi:hypothetical protein
MPRFAQRSGYRRDPRAPQSRSQSNLAFQANGRAGFPACVTSHGSVNEKRPRFLEDFVELFRRHFSH